jgi:serine/threonine protein kinase
MTPSDASEQTIFDTARQMAGAVERAAYLDQACAGDPKLRDRVEALLRANARADQFLAGDPLQLGERRPSPPATPPAGEGPGTVISKYRLLEKLGEGGCGVVYMAEQEEPVRRKVALKVIKLGMDTKQVVARFEAERQALALMDHPNIAKVLDAGATDTGRPYFVMELVGGIKITDYCEQNQLDTRQRLDLFIQVCRAIQHAHQKGVIHRDIKPSNVLVATQDGVPVPKVIDFGIAKATQGRLTDETLFTAFEQFLGTPAYMSPEQAQLGGMDVDTRSDIYSLGVLLYELLTGKTPFDAKELLAAGIETMRRTIQEKEPATPSTRLKQALAAHSIQGPAKSKIENDLDWIVMKCLEKDRARRYETANGLARDLERHLKSEPVAASPPNVAYRMRKFVRRNRGSVAAAAVVASVLVLGLFATTWEAVRAVRAEREQSRLRREAQTAQASESREREKAQTEATKSKQVAQFLKEMLQGVGPSKALGRDTTMLREILDKTVERVGRELTNQPETELELRKVLAGTYQDLGLYPQMEEMAKENLRLSRAGFGEENEVVSQALLQLGVAQRCLKNFVPAESNLRQALNLQKRLHGNEHRELPATYYELGAVLWHQEKLDDAEAIFREGLVVGRKVCGDESAEVAALLRGLGLVLFSGDRLAEAVANHREALAIFRKLFHEQHPEVAKTLNDLGMALRTLGSLDEAEATLRQALAIRRKVLGNDHEETADSVGILGDVLWMRGRLAEAETMMRESCAIKKKAFGYPDSGHVGRLAVLLLEEGKNAEVEAMYRQELPGIRAHLATDSPWLARALAPFARALLNLGKFNEAEPLARECLVIFEKTLPDDWRTFNARSMVGGCLLGERKYAEAEPLLVSGYQGLKEREATFLDVSKPRLKEALQRLVQLFQSTNRPDQAAEWKQKLEDFERTQTNRVTSGAPPKPPP